MGEITRDELSKELYEHIVSLSSNNKIDICRQILKSIEDNQKVFSLDESLSGNDYIYFDIKINSTWIAPDKYNISENKLKFDSSITMDKDTKIYVTLFKNSMVTKIDSDDTSIAIPDDVSNFTAVPLRNRDVAISWEDPDDVNIGRTIQSWEGTKIVRKVGSYPNNENDGITIVNNRERNKYSKEPFIDKSLSDKVEYFYQAFPYYKSKVNVNTVNRVKCKPKKCKIMGIQIDLNIEDPEKSVTYTDDAVGMQPGSNEWDEFFGHKPCVFKEGKVVGYLKRNNFKEYENGEPNNVFYDSDNPMSCDNKDIMIEFPKRGLIIEKRDKIITLKMTDSDDDPDFKYLAHSKLKSTVDNFYVGAYRGAYCAIDKKYFLISCPYKSDPYITEDINMFRGGAHSRGEGYEIMGFYQLLFIQSMFLLKYKHLNSKNALGTGSVSPGYSQTIGYLYNQGMDYGTNNQGIMIKLFGLESIYGHYYEFVDGIIIRDGDIYTSSSNFTHGGDGYIRRGRSDIDSINKEYFIPFATTELGFIPSEITQSKKYFEDRGSIYKNSKSSGAAFGASHQYYDRDKRDGGLFSLHVPYTCAPDSYRCARLMYI